MPFHIGPEVIVQTKQLKQKIQNDEKTTEEESNNKNRVMYNVQ